MVQSKRGRVSTFESDALVVHGSLGVAAVLSIRRIRGSRHERMGDL